MRLTEQFSRAQTLEEAYAPVAHLAYERNEDVIVMKGYKFARAKVASAAALACMALAHERAGALILQVSGSPMGNHLLSFFELSSLI